MTWSPPHLDGLSANRRQFLRGAAGAALSLPFLDSLVPKALAAASKAKSPVRMAFLYFPNGVWEEAWNPTEQGDKYTLPFSLEPLAPIRSEVLVMTGLDKKHSHEGDGHYAKTANFLTGMPVAKTTGKDVSSGGISVDQLAAKKLGSQTPLPSLELGTEPVVSGVDSNVGFTRLYGSHISWQDAHRPVAKEINPRLVYERLFGKSVTADKSKSKDYENLLDYVLDDVNRLRPKLGRDDQFKMDEYLDAVRAVEKRVEYHAKSKANPKALKSDDPDVVAAARLTGLPGDFREHVDIMLDLMVLAFRSDATRVCTFMFANDVSGRNFSFIDGVRGGHHEMSHHENNAEKIEQYKRINRWHVEQYVRLLEKMRNVKEAGGKTLLDNSMILMGSSMSDGNRHDPDNLPILLGGRAGGVVETGKHVHFDSVPLCNLYLTMLHRMGVAEKSFGDSTGPL